MDAMDRNGYGTSGLTEEEILHLEEYHMARKTFELEALAKRAEEMEKRRREDMYLESELEEGEIRAEMEMSAQLQHDGLEWEEATEKAGIMELEKRLTEQLIAFENEDTAKRNTYEGKTPLVKEMEVSPEVDDRNEVEG